MALNGHAHGALDPLIPHSIFPATASCPICHGMMRAMNLDQREKSQVDLVVYACESCPAVETRIVERDIPERA
jgi:hypothetical protein